MKLPFRKSKQLKKPRAETPKKWKERGKDRGPARRGILGRVFDKSKRFGMKGSGTEASYLAFVWSSRVWNKHVAEVDPKDPLYGDIIEALKVRKGDDVQVALPAVSRIPIGGTGNHILIKVASQDGQGERFFLLKANNSSNSVLFDKIMRKHLEPETLP